MEAGEDETRADKGSRISATTAFSMGAGKMQLGSHLISVRYFKLARAIKISARELKGINWGEAEC